MVYFIKSLLFVAFVIWLFETNFMALASDGEGHSPHFVNSNAVNDKSMQAKDSQYKKKATLAHPFVGMLLTGANDESYWPHCTVTLIRSDAVLTARHCIKNLHGYGLKVYFPYEGFREIETRRISIFCEQIEDKCSIRIDDLAVVALSIPYSVLPVAELGGTSNLDMVIEKTIVGFGLNDGSRSDNGIKREGRVTLNECKQCEHTKSGRRNSAEDIRSLCFDFTIDRFDQNATNLVGSQSGDSGGPMLDAGLQPSPIVGLARGAGWACSDRNHSENRYVDLTNPYYRDWMEETFCEPPCSTALTDNVEKLLEVELAHLDLQNSQDSYRLMIGPGASSLIVTMNHEVGGWDPEPSDLDLHLDLDADCTRYIGVEVCIVQKPISGSHTVSVNRIHKEAAYQLTAIAVYDNPTEVTGGTPTTGSE